MRALDLDLSSHQDAPADILERYRNTGSLSIRFTDAGFRVTTLRALKLSAPVTGLWGKNIKLDAHAYRAIARVDSLSSRSLFKAPRNPSHFVHIGPLARCSHSCFACSNIIPSKDPWTSYLTDGVPRGYNRGAEVRIDTPKGDLLHYSRGHSTGEAWWTRTERSTDFHGVCEFCAGANAALAIHLVDDFSNRPPSDPESSSTSSESDWDAPPAPPVPPEPPPILSPNDPGDPIPSHRENLLGAGTYNVPFSVNLFQRNLTEALRVMYETDLSVAGFTGTNASPSSLLHSDDNMSDRALVHGTFVKKFKTLWSFCPKGRSSGAGATLAWDARIAYSNPFTDEDGRIAAVTLHGPTKAALRVICVYAYANPSADWAGAKRLRATLQSLLKSASDSRLSLLVLGDWQAVQEKPNSPFPPHQGYPKEVALLPLLHKRGLRDTFRRRHPRLHGWSQRQGNSSPGRIDSIWYSKKLLGAPQAPTVMRCHVDQEERYIARSDHRLVTTHIPFRKVFKASASEVRTRQRATTVPVLRISHLVGKKQATEDFHWRLDDYLTRFGLSPALDNWSPKCSCRPTMEDQWPHPPPAVQASVDITDDTEPPPCTCSPPSPPANALEVMNELESQWTETVTKAVDMPDPRPSRPRPRGYKLRRSPLDKLHSSLARLRRRLPRVTNDAALREARSDWAAIIMAAPTVKNLQLPTLETTPDDRWPAAAAAVCARAQARLVANDQQLRVRYIRQKISDRSALHLASFEHGTLKPFLKKLRFTPTRQALQVLTKRGGYTTCPEAVKRKFTSMMREWFRTRRSRPPEHLSTHEELYSQFPPGAIDATSPITMKELLHSLRQVPKGSAPGPSGISAELLRLMPLRALDILRRFLNLILTWGVIPTNFLRANIYPAPKKGKLDLANCRPISLMEVPFKLLTRVVNLRLMRKLSSYLSPNQWGFRPGLCATDPYHVLLGAIEDSVEFSKPLHLSTVDLTKAFDSTEKWSLQQCYKLANLSDATCAFLSASDGTGTASVLTPFGPSPTFPVERGVRQGETLSPLKFLLWMEPWLQSVRKKYPSHGYQLNNEGPRVCVLAYADDIAILGKTHEEVQDIMNSLCAFLHYHAVTISATADDSSKTTYTHNRTGQEYSNLVLSVSQFSRDSTPGHSHSVPIDIKTSPSSKPFRYLGGWVNLDLNWAPAKKKLLSSINLQLRSLSSRKLTILEAASAATTVIQGKAGYYLQLAPFTLKELRQLDSSLDKALRRRGGWPHGTSLHWLHAPRSRGGMGIFSFYDLLVSAQTTELLVRLATPGLVGEVAKARWDAAQPNLHNLLPSHSKTPPKSSLTLYTLWMAAKHGYTIATEADYESVAARHSAADPIHNVVSHKYLPRLESMHVWFLDQLLADGDFRQWPEVSGRHGPAPR